MKATTGSLPRGAVWVFEPKWDGHRVLVRIHNGVVDAVSSSGQPRMQRWPWLAEVAAALHNLGDGEVVLDGEAIAAGDDGKHSFQSLGRPDRNHMFVVFDIVCLNGRDISGLAQSERRDLLEAHVKSVGRVLVTPTTDDGDALLTATRATGFEGIIAKRADSVYLPGRRSTNWIKIKHRAQQEFVIGGYLLGEGGRSTSFGSLLVGVYDGQALRFAGAVGTGFNDATLRELRTQLQERISVSCPFDPEPKLGRGRARWVTPDLVAEVTFAEWTDDAHLRHPVFLGLRDDRPPTKVVRES